MIELGKMSNGVTLFDNDKLVKVDIIKYGPDFLLNFDTRYYDLIKGPYFQWFVYSFEIYRLNNPSLCLSFDEFFQKALNVMNSKISNRQQVNYSSDDDKYIYSTMLGVTNLNGLGYSLDFDKSLKDGSKRTFLLKKCGRYPELASLYAKLFSNISYLAEKGYDECQDRFDYSYMKQLKK